MAAFMTVLAAIIWAGGGLSGFILWFADSDLFTIALTVWISALIFGSILYSISLVLKNQEDILARLYRLESNELRARQKASQPGNQSAPAAPVHRANTSPLVNSAFKKMDEMEKNGR